MATLIKNLKDYKLTTGAIVDFHTRVNELIAATTPAALHVEDLTETYAAQLDTLNSVVNRATAYQNTQLMEQKDKERDNLFSVIRNVVKAHATNTLPAKNEAAVRLGAVMAPYEDLRRHQYNKETTELRGLIKQLKANAGLTATLGIDEEIAELETVNEAFDNAFKAKTEEQAARQEQKGIDTKEAVADISGTYEAMVQRINAYALIQPDETTGKFINDLNGIIDLFNNIQQGSKTATGTGPAADAL